jgi:hypothetical protein
MSDLLSRVTEAREKATAQFIKDMAIHEMAMLQKEIFPTLVDRAMGGLNDRSAKRVKGAMIHLAYSLFSADVFDAASAPQIEMSGLEIDPIIDAARELLKNPDSAARYKRVVNHFKSVQAMIRAYPLDDQTVLPVQRDRVIRVLQQFQDIIPKSIDRAENMYRREQRGFNIEALILQGGGARGIGYAGVENVLRRAHLLRDIKYIGGTSAGALMGLPIALGFSSEEINSIVKQGNFAQFFSESTKLFKLMKMPGLMVDRLRGKVNPKERPYLEGFNLIEFGKEFMMPMLSEATGISQRDLRKMTDVQLDTTLLVKSLDIDKIYSQAKQGFHEKLKKAGRISELGVLNFSGLPGRSEALQACVNAVRSQRDNSHPESDLIESYLGDLIEIAVSRYVVKNPHSEMAKGLHSKEDYRSINFTQLQALAKETDYREFKEFGVAITRNHMFQMSWYPRACANLSAKLASIFRGEKPLNKKYGPQDLNLNFQPIFVRAGEGDYIDLPIKKAVRTSMNLPVVFEPIEIDGARHIDGGMNSNYAHRMFRDKFGGDTYLADERTAGFMLSTIDADMENLSIDALAKVVKKEMAVELEKYPAGFIEKLKNGSRDFGVFMYSLCINVATLKVGKAATQISSALLNPVSHAGGQLINRVMDNNNASLPSEQILENTGVINTGTVATEDFHISAAEKEILIQAGRRSALSLLSGHADRYLRFSKDRLVSLIAIENELCAQKGKPPVLELPFHAMGDAYRLLWALKVSAGSQLCILDTMSGVLPDLVNRATAIEPGKLGMLDECSRTKDYGLKAG